MVAEGELQCSTYHLDALPGRRRFGAGDRLGGATLVFCVGPELRTAEIAGTDPVDRPSGLPTAGHAMAHSDRVGAQIARLGFRRVSLAGMTDPPRPWSCPRTNDRATLPRSWPPERAS